MYGSVSTINGNVSSSMTNIKLTLKNNSQSISIIKVSYFIISDNKQLWPIILSKALATVLGGYKKLASTPCYKLFNLLTGSNSLFFNIKEDPTKNARILRYIADCENKNFIIHAEKVCKNL